MLKRSALAFILSIILSSCGSSIPYAANSPLTHETFFSHDSLFRGIIPLGWFSPASDTVVPALAAWLIRDDYHATLAIRELHLDRLSMQRAGTGGLKSLALATAGLHQTDQNSLTRITSVQEFEIRGTHFCSYEVNTEGEPARSRVVVFALRGKYYECLAEGSGNTWSADDYSRLFTTQQTVLSTLSF